MLQLSKFKDMKKTLSLVFVLSLAFSLQAQFIYKSSKSTAKMDTLQVKGSRVDITNASQNAMAWIRVSGDSLYFGDGTGENSLSSLASQITTNYLKVKYTHVSYTNQTLTTALALPYKAVISDIKIFIDTLFNDSGTALLDVGITGTGDHFFSNVDVKSTQMVFAGTLTNIPYKTIGGPKNITFTYDGQNNDATYGGASIYIYYFIQ
jgi:hypothetical protein